MNILIMDDERSIRNTMKEILEFEGHNVSLAEDGLVGYNMVQENRYDVIFCDIKMPNMDGQEALVKMRESGVETPIIMISGHGSIETAVECIREGAYDFIQKPLDINRILLSVKNAMEKNVLVKETKTLKKKVSKVPVIVGESQAILHIKDMIDRVATSDARVLINGSNGTGKELVARWLHELSNRASKPFIEVNCAAIPSELIESELFGHEKGAFTSAIRQHKGKFEQADGGTLFLDEIGDMSLAAQAKVLRVLQEKKVSRVGSDKEISVDVRVVCATNKNLAEEIKKNNFREDLYHRLSVIVMTVPALKDRKSDIPLLAKHFLKQIAQETGGVEMPIEDDAIEQLMHYEWGGNIRELRNAMERLVILSNNVITKKDVLEYIVPI